MKIVQFITISVLFVFSSCKEVESPANAEVEYEQLYNNTWIRSYEEEEIDRLIRIYRPKDYKEFPPSFFRHQLIFTNDGSCKYLVAGPTDVHSWYNGKWNYIDQSKTIIGIYDSVGMEFNRFKIVELQKNVLKINIL